MKPYVVVVVEYVANLPGDNQVQGLNIRYRADLGSRLRWQEVCARNCSTSTHFVTRYTPRLRLSLHESCQICPAVRYTMRMSDSESEKTVGDAVGNVFKTHPPQSFDD
jgi:hypothetical protein